MQSRRDYYKKRASCGDPLLLQTYRLAQQQQRRLTVGKIDPSSGAGLEPMARRQRSPSFVATTRGPFVCGPNELQLPVRANSSLMLHVLNPGNETCEHSHSSRRLSVNLGKPNHVRSQPNSPDGNSASARIRQNFHHLQGSTGTRPVLGGRSPQSSFDSNGDVGQISLNWMRVNGAIAPFKTLLTSTNSNSPASQPRAHQNAMTREQSGNRLAQLAAASGPTTANPIIYGEFVKHKESLSRPRKQSDPVRIYENGKFF